MCGIFGFVASNDQKFERLRLQTLLNKSQRRGSDSSGMVIQENLAGNYEIYRADYPLSILTNKVNIDRQLKFLMGHSRLITNGHVHNQPVFKNNTALVHNGIIVNADKIWEELGTSKTTDLDSQILLELAISFLEAGVKIEEIAPMIIKKIRGAASCALLFAKQGKLLLFSNTGDLFYGFINEIFVFASEYATLVEVGCPHISQVKHNGFTMDVCPSKCVENEDFKRKRANLVPSLLKDSALAKKLKHPSHNFQRCSKCILPETMPYIKFDRDGVCNYCNSYRPQKKKGDIADLEKLVHKYRRSNGIECVIPFSGGRDSTWSLHIARKLLDLKVVTYTYDWGMVTDLGRRNISSMCSEFGVQNIVVAADINKKRNNIRKNLVSWLKRPHLGMLSLLTAGDKHFFQHIETVKSEVDVKLNLWGTNPLETTHFKAGFLGIKPDFGEATVYRSGVLKQMDYHSKRLWQMLRNPSYINSSIYDTLSGEYYRSFKTREDYFHVFQYMQWNEDECQKILDFYNWERAVDTNASWRIGDGTAAFYNYVYFLKVGFTEHDTFRSNQIREGQLSRKSALELVADENRERYENIKWYLDVLSLDFQDVIEVVNEWATN